MLYNVTDNFFIPCSVWYLLSVLLSLSVPLLAQDSILFLYIYVCIFEVFVQLHHFEICTHTQSNPVHVHHR